MNYPEVPVKFNDPNTYVGQGCLSRYGDGLDGRGDGVRFPAEESDFALQYVWGPPSLLSNGNRWLFPRSYSGTGMKQTIHLTLVPRLRMVEPYLHSPIAFNAVVLN
jgi:hypothetical protein